MEAAGREVVSQLRFDSLVEPHLLARSALTVAQHRRPVVSITMLFLIGAHCVPNP